MDKKIQKKVYCSAEMFKKHYGQSKQIYDIRWGDRFGEPIILVSCFTYKDEEEMKSYLPAKYNDFTVYITSPIWNNLDLIPEIGKQFNKMMDDQYFVNSKRGQRELTEFLNNGIIQERSLWESWCDAKQKEFIISIISERRKINPDFGNCADKFLKD